MNYMNYSVLIVEDEKPILSSLAQAFKQDGFTVQTAKDGHEALMSIEKSSPDLLILDILMPKLDGIAVLEALRKKKLTIPTIVASNYDAPENRAQAKEHGAELFIVKSETSLKDLVAQAKDLVAASQKE